jgi:DNA topoisomerase I
VIRSEKRFGTSTASREELKTILALLRPGGPPRHRARAAGQGCGAQGDRTADRHVERGGFRPPTEMSGFAPTRMANIQATGRDARGRKQYRYHSRWREVRDAAKYEDMIAFGRLLPGLRARIAHDMAEPGLPREKILATIVWLLQTTLIRVGNEGYARENRSYGLTTLRDRHVVVQGATLRFEFKGKSGKV